MIHQPFFIPSLLISLFSIPLVLGVVPRNRWFGVRSVQTMSGENVWLRSNRFAGAAFLFSALIYFLVATFYPAPYPLGAALAPIVLHLLAFALPLAASVLFTLSYAKSLSKTR
jgi:uncharacterized membrane protein